MSNELNSTHTFDLLSVQAARIIQNLARDAIPADTRKEREAIEEVASPIAPQLTAAEELAALGVLLIVTSIMNAKKRSPHGLRIVLPYEDDSRGGAA